MEASINCLQSVSTYGFDNFSLSARVDDKTGSELLAWLWTC
jgi:hypothetical protein